ncbi:Uncharacterised protein [Mycobacterium tuberculosis]|nr:Uncharacterised protein [Mycobacterium tuberculosis]
MVVSARGRGRSRCAVSSRFIKVLRWVKRSLAAREALHCWLMKVNSVVFRAGLADSRFPRVRWMKSSAPSAFSVSNATISTSVKKATRCGDSSRIIIRAVVSASRWLRRNPSIPGAVAPMAIRASGMSWSTS